MMTKQSESTSVKGQVQYIHPPALHYNPAFTNVVKVTGPAKTVYVGGQNALDQSGTIVGKGDIKKQTEQILTNIQVALAAAGRAWNMSLSGIFMSCRDSRSRRVSKSSSTSGETGPTRLPFRWPS